MRPIVGDNIPRVVTDLINQKHNWVQKSFVDRSDSFGWALGRGVCPFLHLRRVLSLVACAALLCQSCYYSFTHEHQCSESDVNIAYTKVFIRGLTISKYYQKVLVKSLISYVKKCGFSVRTSLNVMWIVSPRSKLKRGNAVCSECSYFRKHLDKELFVHITHARGQYWLSKRYFYVLTMKLHYFH